MTVFRPDLSGPIRVPAGPFGSQIGSQDLARPPDLESHAFMILAFKRDRSSSAEGISCASRTASALDLRVERRLSLDPPTDFLVSRS